MAKNFKSVLIPVVTLIIGLAAGSFFTWWHIENDVVVTVNGTPVKSGDFYHRLQMEAGNQVLAQMVTDQLRLQFARQQNAYPTDADIQARLDKAEAQPDFLTKLADAHQTVDDVKHQLTVSEAAAGPLEQGVTVSDADIQAFYQANINPQNPQARFYRPATVQIAAILTTSPQKAQDALNALATGYSFASVARAYSQDKSAAQGGVLPPFQQGRVNEAQFPGLDNLIFSMQVGQQSPVTKIGNAWIIARCLATEPKETESFSQVADDCRDGAMVTKGVQLNGQKVQQAMVEFQKAAVIKAVWPGYNKALQPATVPQQ